MSTSVSGVTSNHNYEAASSTSSSKTGAGQEAVGKEAFLKLLVAQIRNQNPLNPADGVQFLSQLAQFSELEQLININSQLKTLTGAEQNTADQTAKSGGTGAAAAPAEHA